LAHWSLRARIAIACLLLFCVSMSAAVASYAGGSWLHPDAASHSLLENFWCDLLREPAHNGLPNQRAARFGMLGFVALAVSLAGFWLEMADTFHDFRRPFLRMAGSLSSLATAAVALLPSDRFPLLHAPAVLSAGGLGFACGCICSAWALRHFSRARVFGVASVLLVSAAALNLAVYVWVAYLRGVDTVVLPVAQKVATLTLLVWIVAGLSFSAGRPKP
jgi:hypothetical protein